jgi:RimJ/RimL family protein N-acetyltransferase
MAVAEDIEGFAFKLRPIDADDSESILALRNDPELSQYMARLDPDIERQRSWIEWQRTADDDYYFAVVSKTDNSLEGYISLYHFASDEDGTPSAEWARWVLRRGSMAALESAFMIYEFGFALGRRRIYCRTLASNKKVISFHDSMGLVRRKLWPQLFVVNGMAEDAIEHSISAEGWKAGRDRIAALAGRSAKLLRR